MRGEDVRKVDVQVAVTQAEPAWPGLTGANKAGLVVFPERCVPRIGYDLAKNNAIAVSLVFAEDNNHSLYTAQVTIGADGEIKCHRRKMKPMHMERTVFGDTSGHCLSSVAQLPLARIVALSCGEHTEPLLKFNTIAQEEIHVAAWSRLDPHPGGDIVWSMPVEGCETISRAHVVEACVFILHCAPMIYEKSVYARGTTGSPIFSTPGGGGSAVFRPDGRRLTNPLNCATEGIMYANLAVDLILEAKMLLTVQVIQST
ncbi:carbon-nitrogen hydrolase [Pseudomassariella vexata]|uniref:nitrilase n=1 Tax=Pseudomassariella vexata TaxID=1141098 RepID=A0A1Y2DA64_9PEZI|nr:carbon-nitrogen hydrolase [Pseudomassariella vexata]ORY56152.1 carbon-nitrogen hydrolase [Pseudomassariella vexata]